MEPSSTRAPRSTSQTQIPISPERDPRQVKIYARTLFRDMIASGLTHEQIIAMASELVAYVTEDLKDRQGRATLAG